MFLKIAATLILSLISINALAIEDGEKKPGKKFYTYHKIKLDITTNLDISQQTKSTGK